MRRRAVPALFIIVFLIFGCFSPEVFAETRIYHLRVTFRSGERYETISTFDPINYCQAHGGSVRYFRNYSLLYSPEMKVKVLRTWIEPRDNLVEHWREILKSHNMLSNHNRKPLPRVPRLTLADMQRPEQVLLAEKTE